MTTPLKRDVETAAETVLTEPAPPSSPWSPVRPRVRGLLTAPAATLRDAARRGDWIPPALIMLLGLAIYVAPIGYQSGLHQSRVMEEMTREAGQQQRPAPPAEMALFFRTFSAGIGALAAGATVPNVLGLAAASWFARSALLYFFGRVFMKSREGSFLALFTAVGWAWFPLFIQSVLVGLVFAGYPPAVSYFVPMPSGREALQSGGMLQLMNASWRAWVLLFATPFVWWNWALCTLAVEAALNLPRWRAALTVALQVSVHAAYAGAAYFATSAWLRLIESFAATPAPR